MSSGHPKDALRRRLEAQRAALPEATQTHHDASRSHHLVSLLGTEPRTVALYASRRHEPNTTDVITSLHTAGWRVLLPLMGPLPRWALFCGWDRMQPAWGGISEPAPPLMRAQLDEADVVVVACLAVASDGTRLGTGGGWYDRALPHRRPGAQVWALANSWERLDALPQEAHDIPVDAVLTERGVEHF